MAKKVLVINAGSSSIKYQLLDCSRRARLAGGMVERIGEDQGVLTHNGSEIGRGPYPDHEAGLTAVLDAFENEGPSLEDVAAVGHRVVHGGDRFSDPVRIDDEVMKAIEDLTPLAPLHNPANLEGVKVARKLFPELPHAAVFDTAFHQSLAPHAYTYAVPREWDVRRYGFHGTSCAYVSRRAAEELGLAIDHTNLIVLHLGNGASATAVERGRSVDTSMGLTPLEGLVMGTRSGDIDPALPAFLRRTQGLTIERIDGDLNRHSGMLALAGVRDLRQVHRRADTGDEDARLALDVYCHRIRKYVGAYAAVLRRVDAVVFTAGVGENDHQVRAQSLEGLERMGITVDPARNQRGETVISADVSPVKVLVIPTDEELEIAIQTLAITR